MIRITLERGNGYHCGCCRRTWMDTEDVETIEDARRFITRVAFCNKEQDGDAVVTGISEVKDLDIPDIDPEYYKSLQESDKKYKEKEKEEEEEKERKRKEALFAQLQKELGK